MCWKMVRSKSNWTLNTPGFRELSRIPIAAFLGIIKVLLLPFGFMSVQFIPHFKKEPPLSDSPLLLLLLLF